MVHLEGMRKTRGEPHTLIYAKENPVPGDEIDLRFIGVFVIEVAEKTQPCEFLSLGSLVCEDVEDLESATHLEQHQTALPTKSSNIGMTSW